MKLVVGLGNPGLEFEGTRHNVGVDVITSMARSLDVFDWGINKKLLSNLSDTKIASKRILLAKLHTYMNESGIAVSKLYNYYLKKPFVGSLRAENLFVVFDDLDIPLGEYKIQLGKGPKDHNGLNSIYEKLGTKDFWHVRVGIENAETRNSGSSKIPGEKFVLMKFTEIERTVVNRVNEDIVAELVTLLGK